MPQIKNPKKTTTPEVKDDRKVVYSKKEVKVYYKDHLGWLKASKAKDLLGWEETEGDDFLFKDRLGKKIKCLNNTSNRPFHLRLALDYMMDILNKRWQENGDPMVIGKYGSIISAQHRLVALVLAEQERGLQGRWKEEWEEAVSMPTILVLGIEETDEVVNTNDTGKSRTDSDVLYRSAPFQSFVPSARKPLASLTAHAIRMLWHRTGSDNDAFAVTKKHSIILDFLNRHPSLLDYVVHLRTESEKKVTGPDGEDTAVNPLKTVTAPGYAAALAYLMATSDSDGDEYANRIRAGDYPTEAMLNFRNAKKAKEFFTAIGKGTLFQVIQAISELQGPEGQNVVTRGARFTILAKAWARFKMKEDFSSDEILPVIDKTDDGEELMESVPSVGGIDLGEPRKEPKKPKRRTDTGDPEEGEDNEEIGEENEEEDNEYDLDPSDSDGASDDNGEGDEGSDEDDPSPEELEERKEKERLRHLEEKKEKLKEAKERNKKAKEAKEEELKAGNGSEVIGKRKPIARKP